MSENHTSISEGSIRAMSKEVFDENISEHELHCSIGDKVDKLRTTVNRMVGGLILLSGMTGLVGWAINRSVTKQDELQKSMQDLRIMVEKHTAATSRAEEPAERIRVANQP